MERGPVVRTGTLLLEGVVEGVDPLEDLGRGAVAEDCVGARVVGEDGVGWGGLGVGSAGSVGRRMVLIGLRGHCQTVWFGWMCDNNGDWKEI